MIENRGFNLLIWSTMKANSVQILLDRWDTYPHYYIIALQWLAQCPWDKGQNFYHDHNVRTLHVSQPHLMSHFLFVPWLPDILHFLRTFADGHPWAWNTLTSSSIILLTPILQVQQQPPLPWPWPRSTGQTLQSLLMYSYNNIVLSFKVSIIVMNLHVLVLFFYSFLSHSLNCTRTEIVCIFANSQYPAELYAHLRYSVIFVK